MSSKPIRFPFFSLPKTSRKRPLIWLSLENLHDPDGEVTIYPALLDTGADSSAVPKSLCRNLKHVFEAGTSPSTTGGVGECRVRTFCHTNRVTILESIEGDWKPGVGNKVFSPIEFSLNFIDQNLPFILLGQADFLNLFEYTQNRSEGWFSLRRL